TERPLGQDEPYVFTTGSAFRDYDTFFKAVDRLGYRTLVLSGTRALAGLDVPTNVEILEQIPRPEIRRLVRHARVNVLPLSPEAATAGLVTIVEAFRHGRSLVATRRPGLDDYFIENETVLCADLHDVTGLAEAIERMWSDDDERARLDRGATEFGLTHCTDEAAAGHLVRVLDEVAPGVSADAR
ncbi:MAG: glycosyltransferase, partial [Actinomycetota bacterium]